MDMSNVRPYAFAPHYLFGEEHAGLCRFAREGQEYTANPVDVSREHLCVAIGESLTPPEVGETIPEIHIRVLDRDFTFPCLTVKAVRQEPWCPTEIDFCTLHCENSIQYLWEISYLLRSAPALSSDVSYDDISLPKVPARGLYTEEARQARLALVRPWTRCRKSVSTRANWSATLRH
jgi:hydroxymethylglutaryl-CoA reductase (NADPH)